MATIEERAKTRGAEPLTEEDVKVLHNVRGALSAFEVGYILGATEQKAIDDNHLREVKEMVIDKACEWLESHFRDIENPDFYSKRNHPTDIESMYHWSVKELVDDFRKAMEE